MYIRQLVCKICALDSLPQCLCLKNLSIRIILKASSRGLLIIDCEFNMYSFCNGEYLGEILKKMTRPGLYLSNVRNSDRAT